MNHQVTQVQKVIIVQLISDDEAMELASDVLTEDLLGYNSGADPQYLLSDLEGNIENTNLEDELERKVVQKAGFLKHFSTQLLSIPWLCSQ